MSIHVALHHVTHYKYDRPVQLGPAGRAAAAGAALPQPSSRTRCEVEPARALRQLAAGSVRQLPGAARVPREDDASSRSTVDLVAEMAVDQPVRLLPRAAGRELPVRLRPSSLAQELAPYLAARRRDGRCCRRYLGDDRPHASSAPSTSWSALNQRLQQRRRLPDPHGARRADAGGDARRSGSGSCRDSAWLLVQLLRHLGLAARFVSGYLIQLDARREAARRPGGHRRRLHRPARLVRGLPAGRRLDRPRPDLGPARRRRPHPARLHAASRRSAAPISGAVDDVRGRVRPSTMTVTRIREIAARHQAVHRRAVGGDRRARRRGRRASSRRGDVRLTMGGEPTFVSVDDLRRRRVEHRRRSGPTKRALRRRRCCGGCATRFAPGGLLHFGQGKWYPGEPLPRWALSMLLARATASRCGATPRCSPTSASPTRYDRDDARALRRRAGRRAWASTAELRPARLRRRLVLPVARAPAAGQRRSVRRRGSTTSWSARGCAASSTQGSARVVGYVLPLAPASRGPAARAGQRRRGSCATSACT